MVVSKNIDEKLRDKIKIVGMVKEWAEHMCQKEQLT